MVEALQTAPALDSIIDAAIMQGISGLSRIDYNLLPVWLLNPDR